MKIRDYRIGFIGFGHMAQVLFKAMDACKLIARSQMLFVRRDTHKMRANEQEFGITSSSLEYLVRQSDLLLLAVRPSQAPAILQDLSRIGIKDKLLITVLAGVCLETYQKYLGPDAQIVRVMPNIASAVQEGMSILTFGASVSQDFREATHALFSSFGSCLEASEDLCDISCAIAGSGPGFVFRLIDAMARAGQEQGLDYAEALKMTAQTFAGAAKLILKGALPADLIRRIAVPNGTTEAGFRVMQEREIEQSLRKTVAATAQRSAEISREFLKHDQDQKR